MPEPITLETLLAMRGRPVVDRSGEEIGSVEEVYYDRATRLPEWIGVSTSFLGLKRVLVPTLDARIDKGIVRVAFDRDRVVDTPSIHDVEIDEEMERQLYARYGLDYSQHASSSGLPPEAEATHEVERWLWPEPQPETTVTGSAAGLESEARVDVDGVEVPAEITEEPHIAGEPAAAAPYQPVTEPMPAAGGAETTQPGSSPQPRLEDAPPVLSDMPSDVPGTLHDTSGAAEERRAGRSSRTVMAATGVGALALGLWLMNRRRRRRHED